MSSKGSPVKPKKPRGVPGKPKKAKQDEDIPVVLEEFTDEIQSIEKDLLARKLGSVKLYIDHMTFEWKSGKNRPVAEPTRLNILKEHMRNGVYRTDPPHRMSGILDSKIFKESMLHPDTGKKVSLAELKTLNQDAKFPTLKPSVKVEMQSGQHRMAALGQLKPGPEEQWWIVTIYDSSMSPLSQRLIS